VAAAHALLAIQMRHLEQSRTDGGMDR